MAYTTTVLAWGVVDYEAAYTSAGMYSVVVVYVQNARFGKKDVVRVLKEFLFYEVYYAC